MWRMVGKPLIWSNPLLISRELRPCFSLSGKNASFSWTCPQYKVCGGAGCLRLIWEDRERHVLPVLFFRCHRAPHTRTTNVSPSHSTPASVQSSVPRVSRSGQEGPMGRGLGLAPSRSTNQTSIECLLGASAEGTQSGINWGPRFSRDMLSSGRITHE